MTRPDSTGDTPVEEMEPLARFGDNLLRIRQARRLSQEALAERANIHRTQISHFETGQRQPQLETLIKLAGALEVPVEMLIDGIRFVPGAGGGRVCATRPPELPRVSSAGGGDRR